MIVILRLLFVLVFLSYLCDASLTSNDERPCPDDIIVFTCNVSGADLIWQVFSNEDSQVVGFFIDDRTMVNVPVKMMGFTAILRSRTPDSNLSSILTTPASVQINGYIVICADSGMEIGRKTIQLSNPPSPPVIIDVPSSQQSSAESVIVTIEWNPPVNSSGADIHNYTVNVSPSTQPSATVVTSTNVNVTVDYNVNYTLSIVATNCAGNSNPAVYMFSVPGCPSLTAPSGGVLDPDTNRALGPGAIVTYRCNQGFMPAGPMTVTCMDNLMWDPNPSTLLCEPVTTTAPPITCGSPQPPSNGSVNFGNQSPYVQGTTITFQCDNGLFPNDTMTATCSRDVLGMGEWNPNPADLICRGAPVNCRVPDEPMSGTILDYDNIVTIEGSEITFQCNPGLSPEGEMTATCTNAGIWSPDPAGVTCMNITDINDNRAIEIAVGVVVAFLGVIVIIIIIIVLVVVLQRRRGIYYKSSSTQAVEMSSTANFESKDTLQATPQGEYSELRHDGPKKGSKKKQPPLADSEGYNRITHKQDSAPLTYDEVVLDSEKKVQVDPSGYSTMNNGQRSQALPGYSQLNTDKTAFVESVVYSDVGTKLKKPAVECYVDQHQVTYSTVDVKATQRKAATLPATSSSSDKAAAADKLLNLDQALIQLRPVHSKWKEIGQALRVPVTFIEQLEEALSLDDTSKMTEITDHWMRECSGKPTWRELADALKMIGEVQLAQQFMQIYETGRLPVELDMNEVPKGVFKHESAPPPPVPTRSPTLTEADTGPGSSKTLPPRPPKPGADRPPGRPPKPASRNEPAAPPRPPKHPRQ